MRAVTVIGGGAAGMLAAGRAAELGASVTLLEKNGLLGKKLLITGKGRCNITNYCDVKGFIENIPGNPRFMYSALNAFDSAVLIELLNSLGLKTKVERGNRVFPESDRSADVVAAFERYMRERGVDVRLNHEVKELRQAGGGFEVITGGGVFPGGAVIIATGGLSYPLTGSTGDGYGFAKTFGHDVTGLRPSLVPLTVKEAWVRELQGLSLKNAAISLYAGCKPVYSDFGELMFTHYGVSGPVILSASRHIFSRESGARLVIDLKPALSHEQLDARLLRDFGGNINREFRNSLGELLPQKMIPVVVGLSGIAPSKRVNSVTREERLSLARLLKGLELTITGTRGFNEAVITVGGVSVGGINPKTMESKLINGLYFCGEVLDVDAFTGGYNLQIAFSTGYAAGTAAGGGERL